MPNIKSAKKRLRLSQMQRDRNLPRKTRIRRCRRAFLESVASGDSAAATQAYREFCSSLDLGVKAGAIKRNTAVRGKTRAAAKLRSLAAG